jgi:hypothetical protein
MQHKIAQPRLRRHHGVADWHTGVTQGRVLCRRGSIRIWWPQVKLKLKLRLVFESDVVLSCPRATVLELIPEVDLCRRCVP